MRTRELLAFDLGASNGRAVLGRFDGSTLKLEELHRFDNVHTYKHGLYYWDVKKLFSELKNGFISMRKQTGHSPDCFGIDTWGVDFGLLDRSGSLLGNPRSYRIATDTEMESAWKLVPKRTMFDRAGIAAMNFNTAYQLYRRRLEDDKELDKADTMLLMPDLLGYMFTGDKLTEYTNATTTNLLNPFTHDWDMQTINELSLPPHIFTPIDFAGSLRSTINPCIAEEMGIGCVPLAAVGTHDTASAVAAIPGGGSFAFCSSGTWSLFGVETQAPVITDSIYSANFSNEGTVQGGFCPLNNIMGLWLIQECRREWGRKGTRLSWNEIVQLAEKEVPFRSIIDPDYPPFFSAGWMLEKIIEYCKATNQPQPESIGQFARCIYESLALKYRYTFDVLEVIKGERINTLNIVGGGIQNCLLNQMVADSIERPVITGPIEGACAGSILMQAKALGEIGDISEVREVVKRSFPLKLYEPHTTDQWHDAFLRLKTYMKLMRV